MKIYELEVEETGFKLFHHRDVKDLYPHFHSVYEFIFIKQGFLEVNIDGETKLSFHHRYFSHKIRHQNLHCSYKRGIMNNVR